MSRMDALMFSRSFNNRSHLTRRRILTVLFVAGALGIGQIVANFAVADNTAQTLPLAQNWTNTALLSASDDWSAVPGIVGYKGAAAPDVSEGGDPQLLTADFSDVGVHVNETDASTSSVDGVAELELTNPTVALRGSAQSDAPNIVININTGDLQNINVAYNLRDIDASSRNAVQPVALQYRVGSAGSFTNVPAGFVSDVTTGPNQATRVTSVSAQLPSAADNQPLVQVRIITVNAAGEDEWVGVDDVNITGSASGNPTNPTGTVSAAPATVPAGSATLLTVAVTAGANPTSTGLSVTGDLAAIGGSATQQFYDNGTNGDVAAGDLTFSFQATVANNTTPGAKTLSIGIADAESRTGTASVALTVEPPPSTDPTGTAAATPSSITAGNSTLLTVAVTPGTNPTSANLTVRGDLTTIGGAAVQQFYDDGTHGDVTSGDDTFSYFVDVPANTAAGAKTINAQIADAESRTASASITLTINDAPTNPNGTGSATPNSAIPGATTLLTVAVTPGANPTSTNLSVTADLTSIGGATAQSFYNDGTNGDVTANDQTFSFQAAVASATAPGVKTLPVTIRDAEARTGATNIALTVSPPPTTNPTVAGAANPNAARVGEAVLLTVAVTPGAYPASTNLRVSGDLRAINNSTAQTFYDDGTNGDVTAGDLTFSYRANVANGTASGAKTFAVRAVDGQGRAGTGAIALTVQPPVTNAPTGTGRASLDTVALGSSVLLSVTVTPATNPASTGLRVTGNLNAIGGSATQQLYDDGTNGDQTAGDLTFSFSQSVTNVSAPGAKTISLTITDAQSRSGATSIALTVVTQAQNEALSALYEQNFNAGHGGWHTYVYGAYEAALQSFMTGQETVSLIPAPWVSDGANGYIEPRSPWWEVSSYRSPGAGYLGIVSFVWLNGYSGGIPQTQLNLRDARLKLRMMTESLDLRGGHIYFWFQTYDVESGKYVNFALTKYPLDVIARRDGWSDLSVRLSATDADWTCLGAAVERQPTYGCIPIERALGNVTVNLGLIVLPINPADRPTGRVRLDNFGLYQLTPTSTPTGAGAASPAEVSVGSQTLLTVQATPGVNPTSTSLAVNGNLASIGGSATQQFYDNGTNGDAVAGDRTFSFRATVPGNTPLGAKNLTATVSDAQGRTSANQIALTVLNTPTAPTGVGTANPLTVAAGTSTLFTVAVAPGANPTSTNLSVTADLSTINRSATQIFYDDGTNGDLVAGDRTFSFRAFVPTSVTPGSKSVSARITDGQGRTGASAIALSVTSSSVNPTGAGVASPNPVAAGGATLLTMAVVPGANPASTNLSVVSNLAAINGSATQTFYDDGTNGDGTAGDRIFSFRAIVPAGATAGAKNLTATITDAQSRTTTAAIALVVAVVAPPPRTDSEALVTIYENRFSSDPGGWLTYIYGARDNAIASFTDGGQQVSMIPNLWVSDGNNGGFIESRSPFWIDANHRSDGGQPPGAGYLSLVSFIYVANGAYGGIPEPSIDLLDARLSFRLMTENLDLRGGHLVFWFQTYDAASGKAVNFALTKYPLEGMARNGVWREFTLRLGTSEADWTCLGTRTARQETYGCSDVATALSNVIYDFGFIILPLDPTGAANRDFTRLPTGVIRFDDIKLQTSMR